MENAIAAPPPSGTCSRMIVSELSTPVSAPLLSSRSTSGGSGLPCASVRLSTPTSRMFWSPPSPSPTAEVVVMPAVTSR
jgi:hypothetical protein